MRTWQLQNAKARLSELLRCVSAEGPQEITVRGKDAYVVLTREEFEKRKGSGKSDGMSLWEALRQAPLGDDFDADSVRDRTPARDVDL